jgi:hypothetical protein
MMLCGAAGCSDPATVVGDACAAEVTLMASPTLPPTLTWTPDCAVGTLSVTTEPGDLLWTIFSEPQPDLTPTNQIRSGVIYGIVPAESRQSREPVPLTPGQSYRVILHVIDSHGDDTLVGTDLFGVPTD